MKWFINRSTRTKLLLGFGLLIVFLAGVTATAMASIKQATVQNVASAKQMETSARNLNDVGRKLKQLIERYKV